MNYKTRLKHLRKRTMIFFIRKYRQHTKTLKFLFVTSSIYRYVIAPVYDFFFEVA